MSVDQWSADQFERSRVVYRTPTWLWSVCLGLLIALVIIVYLADVGDLLFPASWSYNFLLDTLKSPPISFAILISTTILAVIVFFVVDRYLRRRHYKRAKNSGYRLSKCASLFANACADKELLNQWIKTVGHASWIDRGEKAIVEDSQGVYVCQMSEDTVLEFIDSHIRRTRTKGRIERLRSNAQAASR